MRHLTATLARVLRARPVADADVHLHGGSHGAWVCDTPNCTSPALDLTDR